MIALYCKFLVFVFKAFFYLSKWDTCCPLLKTSWPCFNLIDDLRSKTCLEGKHEILHYKIDLEKIQQLQGKREHTLCKL